MEILSLCLYIIISLMQYQTGFSLLNNTINHLCRQEQSQLLLQLKQQLPFRNDSIYTRSPTPRTFYYKAMYWNESSDCCLWDGVTCDESKGYVIGLDLSDSDLTGNIHSNSSLFRLTRLRQLNLAYNYFMVSENSFDFWRLNHLTHLNLSSFNFGGRVPPEFYHLSNLVLLDLSMLPAVNLDIKMLLGNMTKLRVLLIPNVDISSELPMNMSSFLTHLDLSSSNLHGKLPETIFEKPNLQVLRLYSNEGLKGSLPKSLNQSHVHSIKKLDLSGTGISGRLPDSLGSMNKLNYMNLDGCKFSGSIPESIGNISEITEINLSSNNFSGQVPSTIANLQQLTRLDLSDNHLEGQIPEAFSDLQKLTYVSLQWNYLVGPIPSSLTNMSQLQELYISSNALTGPFPSRAAGGRLQKLSHMNLSDNSIQGMIPSWLLSLPSLEKLDLSINMLTGQTGKFNCKSLSYLDLSNNQLQVDLESFSNLSETQFLSLSYNRLTKSAHEFVNVTLPKLVQLELSSCEIKEFPHFLRNLPSLQKLNLPNNKIRGPIPSWFTSMSWQDLFYLDLSANYLTYAGNLPWQNLGFLFLQSNSLQGAFPLPFCNMSQLIILNLSNNKLSGEIPDCIGNSNLPLEVFDLRRNQFYGKIPSTIWGSLKYLRNIGLNENHLEGPLPRSLANCTELEVLDLGNNKMHDTFPWWLENLTELKILILKSNRFHDSIRPPVSKDSFSNLQIIDLSFNNFTGLLPENLFASLHAMEKQSQDSTFGLYMGDDFYQYSVTLSVKGRDVELTRVLRIFTTIDLSSNHFHGCIPESIAYLSSLRLLNLSHNSINGSIPPALGRLTNLEQLDLSSNQLTGGIPQTLTNLTFLAVLNLSHNHHVGPIPQGKQFPTFSSDSYADNSGLCGAPLTRSCGDPPSPIVFEEDDDDDSAGFLTGFTWKAVVMGYGCGIVFGFILGNVMISVGKPRWFARFVNAEAENCLNRRKKRGRMYGTR